MPIQRCGCKNTYQDEKYGEGMRVRNEVKGGGYPRCTSCGQPVNIANAKVKFLAAYERLKNSLK